MTLIVQLEGVAEPMTSTQAIVYLGVRGVSPWTIHEMLGKRTSLRSIAARMYEARRQGHQIPRYCKYGLWRVPA